MTTPTWGILPYDDSEHWLFVDLYGKPHFVRVYVKDGKSWMVKDGRRQRVRYGLWMPMKPPVFNEIVTLKDYTLDEMFKAIANDVKR